MENGQGKTTVAGEAKGFEVSEVRLLTGSYSSGDH